MNKVSKVINKNEQYLEKSIDLLLQDIVHAGIFNQLILDLVEHFKVDKNVLSQANTFWSLTLTALKESRMIRLCRIVDTQDNAISVPNMLNAIYDCKDMVSKAQFLKRLEGNPFADSLAEGDRSIDDDILMNDIETYKNNETVNKIIRWRNNVFAHKSIKSGINDFKIIENDVLDYSEIERFLKYCHTLIDKYQTKLVARTWSRQMIGGDDYKSVFRYMKLGLEKQKNEDSRFLEEYKKKYT